MATDMSFIGIERANVTAPAGWDPETARHGDLETVTALLPADDRAIWGVHADSEVAIVRKFHCELM